MYLKVDDKTEMVIDLSSSLLCDDDLMNRIETDAQLRQVSKLYLYNNKITDRGVMSLLMNLPNLRFLDIRYNPISDQLISLLQRYRWDEALRVCYFDHRTGLSSIVYLNGRDYSDNVMRLTMSGLKGLSEILKGLKMPLSENKIA